MNFTEKSSSFPSAPNSIIAIALGTRLCMQRGAIFCPLEKSEQALKQNVLLTCPTHSSLSPPITSPWKEPYDITSLHNLFSVRKPYVQICKKYLCIVRTIHPPPSTATCTPANISNALFYAPITPSPIS